MAIYGSLGDIDLISTDYPSIQPTLDLNFAKTKALDPRITFYRNSLATYTDDKGIIRTVPENVPRFDHDPTTGESLGLLIEESRTNVGLYSEQFNQWTNDGVTVSANATTAPDGTTTADLITGTSGNRRIYLINVVSNGPVYTYSIFVKKNVGSTIRFDNINVGSTSTQFNFDTGVLTLSGNFTSGTVTSYLNGWYRISLTYTSNGASASLGPYFVNTNDSCYMWGYQFELGSFPTSYIPTSGSAVTRSADFVEMSGTNFSNWYNPIESTFYTNYIINSLDAAYNNPSFYAYDNASAQNYLAIFGYNPAYAWAQASNATAAGISLGGTTTTNVDYKVSFGVKVNDFAASINGSTVSTDTSGNVPVVNQMFIGKRVEVSNAHLNGTLKRLTYYPKRLTNTQLQNLTA